MNPRFQMIAADLERRSLQRFGTPPAAIVDAHVWAVFQVRGDDALGRWTPEADAAFRVRATR